MHGHTLYLFVCINKIQNYLTAFIHMMFITGIYSFQNFASKKIQII